MELYRQPKGTRPGAIVHGRVLITRKPYQRITTDSALQHFVTHLLHPIAVPQGNPPESNLSKAGIILTSVPKSMRLMTSTFEPKQFTLMYAAPSFTTNQLRKNSPTCHSPATTSPRLGENAFAASNHPAELQHVGRNSAAYSANAMKSGAIRSAIAPSDRLSPHLLCRPLHDPHHVRHDAVDLEILRRVDGGDAELL